MSFVSNKKLSQNQAVIYISTCMRERKRAKTGTAKEGAPSAKGSNHII